MIVIERILICDGCPAFEKVEGSLRAFRYLIRKPGAGGWVHVRRGQSMKDFCGKCVKAGRTV